MIPLSQELRPALVAISGGAGDIGQAIAAAMRAAGAEVALADLHAECASPYDFYASLDVRDSDATEAWYEKVVAHFGRAPNVIIPNAAIVTQASLLELSAAQWQREIEVNLHGAFHFAQSGVRRLIAAERPGRVIFLGSWAGHAPHARIPAYSISKAALRMLMQTLALEVAPHGILVNEVAPGYVRAGLSGRIFDRDPTLERAARDAVPTRQLLPASAVAQQILALCSPAFDYTTGTTLLQDGGLSLLQGPQ